MIEIGINPIAFHIGPIEVRWYGIFITLSILWILFWALRAARRDPRISYDTIFTAGIIAIPSGIIFSRLFHVIDQWGFYSQSGQIIGAAGLTAYGGVLGASLGIWVYGKFTKFPAGYFLDLLAPGIVLSHAIGRIGCTINGCCYGIESNLPWAIVYTNPNTYGPLGIATQPTTVYEMLFLGATFPLLLKLRGRLRPEGSLFLIYLAIYSAWRFGSDWLRVGTEFAFGLHQAQFVALITLAIAVSILAYKTRWVKAEAKVENRRSDVQTGPR